MALRPVAPPPYAAPPPIDPMNAVPMGVAPGPTPPPYSPGNGQPPWAPDAVAAPPPPQPPPGGAAPDYSQPGGEPPFGGTPYWSGVMRNYLDMITKPQGMPRPPALDNTQIAAYMLNPAMRGQLMEMYQTPYHAALAQARSHEEMIGHGLTGAAHMLSAAGEYEQRQHEDQRETAQRNYASARTAAEAGDVAFDYKAAGAPELYSVAQERATTIGAVHDPKTRVQVEERNRKELSGLIEKERSGLDAVRKQRIDLSTNVNTAYTLRDETDPEALKTYRGSLTGLNKDLVSEEKTRSDRVWALSQLGTALGPHGEPSDYQLFAAMSGPEREERIRRMIARRDARAVAQPNSPDSAATDYYNQKILTRPAATGQP